MSYRGMLCAVVMCLAGCTSPGLPAAAETSTITFTVSDNTYDEVWEAVVRVASHNLTIVEESRAAGSLKATRGVLMGPWGDVVEISVRPAHNGAAAYSIELESTKQPASRLPDSDWEHTMVEKIRSELGQYQG